jgi:hypothetical protein
MMRQIVFPEKVAGLAAQERKALRALHYAFSEARNRDSLSLADRQLIRSRELNAAVPYARIRLGNSLWNGFNACFGLSESQPIPSEPMFYVTPVDIGCMTPLNASQVDLVKFIQHLRRGLRGLSYVGVVDVSLYAHISPGTNFADISGVSWHLHLFAWGETRSAIKSRAKALNAEIDNYRPILPRPEGLGFHWQEITEENYARLFRYMCKTPRKAYRIGCTNKTDDKGRTVIKFTQGKSELRPGQRVRLFNLLKQFSLNELIVAGGEGVELRRRALRSASQF